MELEAGMANQPALDGRGLVRGVVVQHHVHGQMPGHAAFDGVQEPLELLGSVAGGHIGDDPPGGQSAFEDLTGVAS
jgi:hypothetical protein